MDFSGSKYKDADWNDIEMVTGRGQADEFHRHFENRGRRIAKGLDVECDRKEL